MRQSAVRTMFQSLRNYKELDDVDLMTSLRALYKSGYSAGRKQRKKLTKEDDGGSSALGGDK